MGRSGYSEDCDPDNNAYLLWPSVVKRSIKGRRGQTFLRALAKEMDAMQEKRLISGELVSQEGDCCAMGVVCKARGIDVSNVDYTDREAVAELFDIAPTLAAEIAYLNDDDFGHEAAYRAGAIPGLSSETPEERWLRMRDWVEKELSNV